MKKEKNIDHCSTCSQPYKTKCPACGRMVLVREGTYDTHLQSICLGSHIEWKTCPKSEKELTQPATHKA